MPQILEAVVATTGGGPGTPGADGRDGGGLTIRYDFSTTTTDSDPGSGGLRLNNATQNASTVIRVDLEDVNGSDFSAALATIDDSTSTVKGHVRLCRAANQSAYILFAITSISAESGYYNLTGSVVSASATDPFSNGEELVFAFSRTGDKGTTGDAGTNGTNGTNGTDGDDGADGNDGNHGGAVTIRYVFDDSTSASDPGNGEFRLDNATQNTSTAIFLDLLDSLGVSVDDILTSFNSSTTFAAVGTIRLVKEFDPTKWLLFNVQAVVPDTGFKVAIVDILASSGANPFVNGDAVLLCFSRTGDKGDNGLTGPAGADALQSPNARLTLVSGDPVGVATNVSTIYYTPYLGNRIPLYNGASWVTHYLNSEISVAVPSTQFRMFDIFVYDNAGTLTLETADWSTNSGTITAATNATPVVCTSNSHGLNAGDIVGIYGIGGNTALNGEVWQVSVAGTNSFTLRGSAGNGTFSGNGTWVKISGQSNSGLTTQDGIPVKSGDATRRYVGIGMTTGVSGETTYGSNPGRGWLTNFYNPIDSVVTYFDATGHTYGVTGARPWNGDGRAYISYLVPYRTVITEVGNCHPIIYMSAVTGTVGVGFGNQNNNTWNRYVVSTQLTTPTRHGCTGFTEYGEGFSWSGIVEDRLSASTANFTQIVAQVRVKR